VHLLQPFLDFFFKSFLDLIKIDILYASSFYGIENLQSLQQACSQVHCRVQACPLFFILHFFRTIFLVSKLTARNSFIVVSLVFFDAAALCNFT
jgi:hypothetical protein